MEHAVRGSRRSANDIIEASLQRKHEKRTVNGTRGVGGVTAVRGPSVRLGSIRFKTKRPELTRVGSWGQLQKVSGVPLGCFISIDRRCRVGAFRRNRFHPAGPAEMG